MYQLSGNATTESTTDYNGTLSTYFDNNTSLESNHTSLDNETTIVSPTDANSSAIVSEVTLPENASSTKIISPNSTTLKSKASVEIVTAYDYDHSLVFVINFAKFCGEVAFD